MATETLEKISSNLESPDDFFNFRLSNCKAWKGSSYTFVEKFFVKKRILWTEHALDAFADMTTHTEQFDTLFRKLEHLTFCAPPLLKECKEADIQHRFKGPDISRELEPYFNRLYGTHRYFVEKDWKWGLRSLRIFFRRLKKIRPNISISLEGLDRSGIDDRSPLGGRTWGFARFMRYHAFLEAKATSPMRTEDLRNNLRTHLKQENMLGMVLEGVSSALLRISILRLDIQWTRDCNILLGQNFFPKLLTELPRLELCFQNLRMLSLRIAEDWGEMNISGSSVERGLVRFWSACSDLEFFQFQGGFGGKYEDNFLDKGLPLLRAGRLEVLFIGNTLCSSEQLSAVLKMHKATLRCLQLCQIALGYDDSLEAVLDDIRKLPRLGHLCMRRIIGYDRDDSLCSIHFPGQSWQKCIAAGSNGTKTQTNPSDGQDSPRSGDADDVGSEVIGLSEHIELHGDQIVKLLPAIRTHLVYEKYAFE